MVNVLAGSSTACDTHEEGRPFRLGYGIMYCDPVDKGPELIDVSADMFDDFFTEHFPNYGIEHYGGRPASDDHIRFIHADRDVPQLIENRIGMVRFHGSKPYRWMIRKDLFDEKQRDKVSRQRAHDPAGTAGSEYEI